MLYLWIVLAVVFVIAEAASFQLVSIWFSVGSIVALIAQLAGAPTSVQCVLFVTVSLVSVIATRPFLNKFKKGIVPTNIDRMIGQECIVTQEIDNTHGKGEVKVMGNTWSARSVENECIQENTKVIIEKIDGVKLLVKKSN